MAKRTSTRQSKHDARVTERARQLQSAGWHVKADVSGFRQPDPIGKYKRIPDVVARKAGATKIIEVETADSLSKDQEQRSTFRRSAAQRNRTTFETDVAD